MTEYAIAALGPDRPGVIAALTEVLLADAGNLEDASMTILRGQFAMTLVVDVPLPLAQVQASLAPVADRLGLLISVREVTDVPPGPPARPYQVHLHGADRPGLVHRVTALLADAGVNVTDLTTRLSGTLYVLVAEVDLPESVDPVALAAGLRSVAADLGVEASLQPAQADLL
jgi:glycine cleavage system transcriptional repressor